MAFVHLHSHTEASISDGLFGPKKWVEAIKQKGFKAHAVTDHGVMTSLIPFYHLMKAEKLHPILGVEFYYVDDPTDHTTENRKASHLILLAKNYDGFRNLLKLSKLSFTEGFYFRPRIGLEWLMKYSEGLVCLSACQGGVLSNEVWREKDGRPHLGLIKRFEQFRAIFGDDFYVEFQGHAGEGQEMVNSAFYERLRGLDGFKPVVTNDNHYILPQHAQIQGLLKEMAYRSKNDAAGQSYTECDSLWLKTPKDVYETFRENHEYLPKRFLVDGMTNTEEILEKCMGFELPTGKRYLPSYRKNIDSKEMFKRITVDALAKFISEKRCVVPAKDYKERFAKEYKVITKYHLEDYFLIVWDIVRFANEKGIFVGLGRGSAAGSLISYLLGIVKIDPLEFGLLFERFLNENRCESGELPDIDLDFESERRDEIKEYIVATYGEECVCAIGTYNRMKLRTALVDFGKALQVGTQRELLNITTTLDLEKEDANDFDAALEATPKLQELVDQKREYAFVVKEIIGQIKSQGVHAAGMLICSDPVETITPVKTQKTSKSSDRIIVTQAEDKYVIAQGLMKMDILGLKEYDIIKYIFENAPNCPYNVHNYVTEILRQEKEQPHAEVWKMFQQGRTEGVFQFSSDGMQDLLKKMRPDRIQDLIAANALFRPGCLENGWHTLYCDRKHGNEEVEYIHEVLKEATGETYGVIVFQEQFMETIHKLGKISLVDSDTIRSALGKKNEEKLNKFREMFVKGAKTEIGEEKANEVWDQIQKAAGYTFNKSHSAAYSVLAYISQYLKVTYPAQFWAAHLEWDVRKGDVEEVLIHKSAAQQMGVKFVMPDVNRSRAGFYVNSKGKPVWPFRGIKGIGEKAALAIEQHGPYSSFEDFYKKTRKHSVKFNNIENLIYAGAFDGFDDRREALRWLYTEKGKKKTMPPLTDEHMMLKFREVMGFFEQKLKKIKDGFSDDVIEEADLRDYYPGMHALVGGMLTEIRSVKTKRGDTMGFATLIDLDETIGLTFFPETWLKFRPLIKEGNIVQIGGKKSGYGGRDNAIDAQTVEKI